MKSSIENHDILDIQIEPVTKDDAIEILASHKKDILQPNMEKFISMSQSQTHF